MVQAYGAMEKVVAHYYSEEDQLIISCPSQEQVTCTFLCVCVCGWAGERVGLVNCM